MVALILSLLGSLRSALRTRADLALENLALRQQLINLRRTSSRARLRNSDRAFWLVLSRFWSRWADVLVVVKPDTVVLSLANQSSGRRTEADSRWPAGPTWCSLARGGRSKRVVADRQTSAISLQRGTAGPAPVKRSGGEALVPVVQAADLGSRHDLAHGRRLSLSRLRRVLAQRQMGP